MHPEPWESGGPEAPQSRSSGGWGHGSRADMVHEDPWEQVYGKQVRGVV